ncbi:MAG: hypothetical protein IPN69_17615 [Acidobacteria bacterium]|nr:hypothetical protein [Acidobacteriota bacterium]
MNITSFMNNENLIDKIVYLMQNDDSADAPADSVKWAKNIFRTRAVEPRRSFVQKIVAVLQMDLAPNKAAFGERSASAAAARQMLFGAGDNSIDLRIAESGKTFSIAGQILGPGFESAVVTLESPELAINAETNELSEFKFPKIGKGIYRLTAKGVAKEIIIDGIEVG